MTRKERFLNKLSSELNKNNIDNTLSIINRYSEEIDKRVKNKEKINDIITSYNIENIIDEQKKYKENKSNIILNIKKKYNDFYEKINKISLKKSYKFKVHKNNKYIKTIILTLTIIIAFFLSIIFLSSLFAILDGAKIYAVSLLLFSILILLLLIIMCNVNDDFTYNRKKYVKLFTLDIIILIIAISLGIHNYYKVKHVYDVSEKYTMSVKEEKISVNDSKVYITFNDIDKPKYIVDYDNTINKIKIEAKYYECFYNYFVNKNGDNIYVSLRKDYKSRISSFINDYKDKEIYDSKELSRYVIKITIPSEYKKKVVIN